ncbi:MAG: isochorismatase family cysteine hydrolase [candidate division WOR-3 bacterium]
MESTFLDHTWGSKIVDELSPKDGDLVVEKSTYDRFVGATLYETLTEIGTRHLFFVGVATNICVETTLRHACCLGFHPVIISDAVAGVGPKSKVEATFYNVRLSFGYVTRTKEILRALRGD